MISSSLSLLASMPVLLTKYETGYLLYVSMRVCMYQPPSPPIGLLKLV